MSAAIETISEIIETIKDYQSYAMLAFVVTVFLTPVAIRVAHRYGVLDIPDKKLKPHAKPIPYLGGTAICIGWSATLMVGVFGGLCEWHLMVPLVMGGIGMSVLGLIDDVWQVPPKIRLLVGAVIVAAVILATGTGFRLVESLIDGITLYMVEQGVAVPAALHNALLFMAVPVSVFIGIIVVLGACNSANLIDGLDGLSTGVTGIISIGFCLLAARLDSIYPDMDGGSVRLVLAMAMVGASLGFLPWNFNPARIFMGDAGSMLLGYNCGMLILLFAEQGILRWVVGALMIFALPVFDTSLAMVRRWRAGRSIFEGDRSHFYDQLVQRGLSVRRTVLVCYMLALTFTAIGLIVIFVRTRYAFFIFVGVCVLTAVLAWAAGLVTPEERRKEKRDVDSGNAATH